MIFINNGSYFSSFTRILDTFCIFFGVLVLSQVSSMNWNTTTSKFDQKILIPSWFWHVLIGYFQGMRSSNVDLECRHWFCDLDEIITDASFRFLFTQHFWHFAEILGFIAIYSNVFLASEFSWSGRSSLRRVLSKNILPLSPAHRFAWEHSKLKATTFIMSRSTSNKRKQPSVFIPNLIVWTPGAWILACFG